MEQRENLELLRPLSAVSATFGSRSWPPLARSKCNRGSFKHPLDCFLLRRGIQVPVASRCDLVHVAGPFLHEPLIDALAGARRNEAVTQAMQAAHPLPL